MKANWLSQNVTLKSLALMVFTTIMLISFQNCGAIDETQKSNYIYVNNSNFYATNDETIDILNAIKSPSAQTSIQANAKPNDQFLIILANGKLNFGATLQLNNNYYFAEEYQNMVDSYLQGKIKSLPTFTQDQLKVVKIILSTNSEYKITSTRPECVAGNHPGPKGEYKNGALVIQAVPVNSTSFDLLTGTASKSANILWEIAIFKLNSAFECF
jgi:hypothetical protein